MKYVYQAVWVVYAWDEENAYSKFLFDSREKALNYLRTVVFEGRYFKGDDDVMDSYKDNLIDKNLPITDDNLFKEALQAEDLFIREYEVQ